jgi:glutathione S-transferase
MRIALYDWGPSPFCLKVRAILDYKRVPYERIPVLGRPMVEVRRRGRVGKVPALDVDGRLVVDSTEIAHELERLFPAPGIVPTDSRQRALCHVVEDWADEALYFIGLHFQWLDAEGAPMVARAFGRSPFGRAALVVYRRRIRAQVVGQGTGRKQPAQIAADLERELDAAAALVDRDPYLLGEQPLLCDFALMGQLVYLSRTPKGGRALARRPAIGAYLERMRALRPAATSQSGPA